MQGIVRGDKQVRDLFITLKQYKIPEFQRNYSWGFKQFDAFWNDLEATQEKNHFFGPVVFVESKFDQGKLLIVDGQQRFTTLQIFLACARDFAFYQLNNPPNPAEPEETFVKRIDLFINTPQTNSYVLEGNYQIKDFLEHWILRNPEKYKDRPRIDIDESIITKKDKKKTVKLVEAWKFFHNKFLSIKGSNEDKILEINRLVNICMDKFFIYPITVDDEEQAWLLFESLNDRGLRLTPSDLLKSHLLSKFKNESADNSVSEALKKWDDSIHSLQNVDMTIFLRHYLLLENKKVKKDDIFDLFKKRINKTGPQKTLEDISYTSNIYGQIIGGTNQHEDEEIAHILENLDMIGIDTIRVFSLATLLYVTDLKQIRKLLQIAEVFAFRSLITNMNAQVFETIIQNAGAVLYNSKGKDIDSAIEIISKAMPENDYFGESFKRNSNQTGSVVSYILRTFEKHFYSGEHTLGNRKKLQVEHIAPKEKDSHWGSLILQGLGVSTEDENEWYTEIVEEIGNKTLLGAPINNKVKRRPWLDKRDGWETNKKDKFEGYKKSKIHLTEDIRFLNDWSREVIEKRSEWMSQSAPRLWNIELKNPKITKFSEFYQDNL